MALKRQGITEIGCYKRVEIYFFNIVFEDRGSEEQCPAFKGSLCSTSLCDPLDLWGVTPSD